MGSRDRPHKEVKKKPKDKSVPAQAGAALRGSAAGGAHPEAAQATVGRGVRRGLTPSGGRGPGPAPSGRLQPHRSEDRMTITGKDLDARNGRRRDKARRRARARPSDAAILAIEKQFGAARS